MGFFKKIIDKVDHTLDHYDEILRSHNAPDMYIGYNSRYGPDVKINTNNDIGGITQKPQAYSANAAKTASSIKQGGMTKDEVQDFNMKHPNETAIRGNE